MKIKKITAIVISVFMLTFSFDGVFARETHYYGDFEPGYVDFSDMHYEKYDIKKFDQGLDNIRRLMKKSASANMIFSALDNLAGEFKHIQTLYALATINASKENTPENNAKVNEAYEIYNNMLKEYNAVIFELYNSHYNNELINWYGEDIEGFIDSYPSEKYYELREEEQDIINEYKNNQFGTLVMEHEGRSYTFDEIMSLLNDAVEKFVLSDIELANEGLIRSDVKKEVQSALGLYNEYMKKSNAALGDFYIRLLKVRAKIAKERGFDNYAEYSYNEEYSRDYTPEDVAKFREYVIKYIVPEYNRLGELLDNAYPDYAPEYDEEDILDIIGDNIGDMSSEMQEAFEYMRKYHLFDTGVSDKKEIPGTAYTVSLPDYRSAYLFESPMNDFVWDLSTTVHEFGHFNAFVHDTVGYEAYGEQNQNLDLAEIHSQGFEMLFMRYYGEIFDEDTAFYKIYRICNMLSSIIEGCLYDEWQYEVYKNPDMSLDEINDLFNNVCGKYYDFEENDITPYSWIMVNHNFNAPMYYISYAMSAVPALEIWKESQVNFDTALDRYMKLTAKGNYKNFKETLSECGFEDVFSERTIKGIADNIKNTFEYEDTDLSDWCYNAITETSMFFDVEDMKFRPYDNASRGVTAEVIGRMQEAENGIEEVPSVFFDTSSKYISWAAAHGIVNGYDGEYFGTYDAVTREQAVSIMYRYADYMGYDVKDSGSFDKFSDAAEVSDWAKESVAWAADMGVINGRDDNTIDPRANVTRAELAQMVSNFMQNVLTN